MCPMPPVEDNGIPVPNSWANAKDTGCLSFFAGPDEGCPTCGSRRYITATLECWSCKFPPAPRWGDVASDLATAQARGFRLYTPSEPCLAHPRSPYFTDMQRCEACQHAEANAAQAERKRLREEAEAAEYAAVRKAQAEECARWKAQAAEAKAAERSARIITRTVRGPKTKMLKRAEEMLSTTTTTVRKPRSATTSKPALPHHRSPRARK